jgi:hypothetical protein
LWRSLWRSFVDNMDQVGLSIVLGASNGLTALGVVVGEDFPTHTQ